MHSQHSTSMTRTVAAKWHLQQEIRAFCASRPRVASHIGDRARRELTPEVMLAFVEASGVRVASLRTAANILKKIKQLWDAFTSVDGAWEKFKRSLGVKSDSFLGAIKELPNKIAALGKKGKEILHKTGIWLTEHVPLFRIYVDAKNKMPSLNHYLLNLVDYLPPSVSSALRSMGKKASELATTIDEFIKKNPVSAVAGSVASAAIFANIWMAATEVSWDIPDIIRGFLGGYSFTELLTSLPESSVGILLSLMFPGLPSAYLLNALMPITVALRIAWMVSQDYATWENGSLSINWGKMGVTPPSDPKLSQSV